MDAEMGLFIGSSVDFITFSRVCLLQILTARIRAPSYLGGFRGLKLRNPKGNLRNGF